MINKSITGTVLRIIKAFVQYLQSVTSETDYTFKFYYH